MLKGPAEKEKGSCGGNERANRVGCIVGGDGSREVEECPLRMRAFQAIVRGKVVRKMHMIVSRCPFTLVMSLAEGHAGIPSLFFSVCRACLVVQRCEERDICILLKEEQSSFRENEANNPFWACYQPVQVSHTHSSTFHVAFFPSFHRRSVL